MGSKQVIALVGAYPPTLCGCCPTKWRCVCYKSLQVQVPASPPAQLLPHACVHGLHRPPAPCCHTQLYPARSAGHSAACLAAASFDSALACVPAHSNSAPDHALVWPGLAWPHLPPCPPPSTPQFSLDSAGDLIELGAGAHGIVFLAQLRGQYVAAKVSRRRGLMAALGCRALCGGLVLLSAGACRGAAGAGRRTEP